MKTERLSSLLASLYNNQSSAETLRRSSEKPAQATTEDAVTINKSISRTAAEQDRAAKVADLKEKVRSGEYKPDSEKTATALLRDLF